MPNSNGFGRRGGGTVTVIEEPVRRNATRNAKITACVVWVAVTMLSACVLASNWHPDHRPVRRALIGLAVAVHHRRGRARLARAAGDLVVAARNRPRPWPWSLAGSGWPTTSHSPTGWA